ERNSLSELPSNTAGAFVGGGNGFTVEPLDRLAPGAGAFLAPGGNLALIQSEGSTGAPTAYVVQYDPFDVVGSFELPGSVVSGVRPANAADASTAWLLTSTGTSTAPTTTATNLSLGDATGVSGAPVLGGLVEGVGPAISGSDSSGAALLQRSGG